MKDTTLLRVGVIGSVVAALCCFTPVLVIALAVVGLSAVTGWLDFVLLPALVFFLALAGYALWRRKVRRISSGPDSASDPRNT